MTPADVDAILAPRPADSAWPPDYPAEQDVRIAGFLTSGHFAFATSERPWGPWIILADGVAIGGCGFHSPPDDNGSVEVGYNVTASRQGRGVATDAVRALIDLARSSGAAQLVAMTDPDNVRSQRVLEKCGFTLTATASDELRWALDLTRAERELPRQPSDGIPR